LHGCMPRVQALEEPFNSAKAFSHESRALRRAPPVHQLSDETQPYCLTHINNITPQSACCVTLNCHRKPLTAAELKGHLSDHHSFPLRSSHRTMPLSFCMYKGATCYLKILSLKSPQFLNIKPSLQRFSSFLVPQALSYPELTTASCLTHKRQSTEDHRDVRAAYARPIN